MPLDVIRSFLRMEAAGGLILTATAVLALVVVNFGAADIYNGFFGTPFTIGFGESWLISKPILLWINDGLMVFFFLLVGLEIKREVVNGELSSIDKASLPVIAAIGGMAVPALVYVALNFNDPVAIRGWAIPAATDIAFALGILSLLGKRVPVSLKIFLTALAIIDDLGAIVIIALFYTAELSLTALAVASVCIALLVVLNLLGLRRPSFYIVLGAIMWVAVLKSGVHATLAGVVLAFTIPLAPGKDGHSMLEEWEHGLHTWVAYLVLPVFAFANAGVYVIGLGFDDLFATVPLGIILGLFVGKQLGIWGLSYGAVRLGWCRLPEGVGWAQFYGIGILAGIGFTMSLFIGTLAFEGTDEALDTGVRIGVLCGSLLSGVAGAAVLLFAPKPRAGTAPQDA